MKRRERKERDLDIVRRLSEGEKAGEIALDVGLTERGIEEVIVRLRAKHEAKNTTHLVATALRKKIIE